MTFHSPIDTTTATADGAHNAFMAAYARAAVRAPYSYFDQHIIKGEDGSMSVVDEGDYGAFVEGLIDRIVHTVSAGRTDEY